MVERIGEIGGREEKKGFVRTRGERGRREENAAIGRDQGLRSELQNENLCLLV